MGMGNVGKTRKGFFRFRDFQVGRVELLRRHVIVSHTFIQSLDVADKVLAPPHIVH